MEGMQFINNNEEPKKKRSLEKSIFERLELKIFYFGIAAGMSVPQNIIRTTGVVAYRHSDALELINKVYGTPGIIVFGDETHSETLKNLLQDVDLEGLAPAKTVTLEKPPEAEDKIAPIERFKTSLIMATAEYIENDNDRRELRRIISTINVPKQI